MTRRTAGEPLGSGGAYVDVYQLDAALTKAGTRTEDRIRLKVAVLREKLLK